MMKKYVFLLLFLICSCVGFSQESATKKYDADIAAFKEYKAGNDGGIRDRLEAAFYSNELSPEAKNQLRKKLVAVFPDATVDGQRTLFRVLFPTIDETSAMPLLRLLEDRKANPESAKIALMIIQEAPGEKIDAALLDLLAKGGGELRFGLIAALSRRNVKAAVPVLAGLARNDKDASLADAAIHALGQISSDESLKILESLEASDKLPASAKDALDRAHETRNPKLRTAFITVPYDPDSWPGQVAGSVQRIDVHKMVAELQAAWLAEKDSAKKKELTLLFASKASLLPKPSDAFLSLLQKAEQINDQKAIIAAMGEKCYLPDVIELATKIMKESEALRATAGLALVRMANTIRRTDPNAAKAILTTVMDQVENKDIAKRAATVLATIGRNEDCIRDWLYAGPFVLDGKSGEETFRHIFPAEADRPEVQWQHLMGGWQGGNRWNLDVGIEPVPNSVACLKTYIWSDMDQQLVFQAACSGGIAAWCDKQPILNQWRNEPFEQWTFSAPIALKKGYNSLVIKTSCADKGWFFSARLRTPDDQSPKNIRVESRRRNPPQKVLLFTGSQTWIHSPTVSGPHGNCCAELVLKSVCRDLGLELVWTDSGDVFNYPLDDYAAFVFYTCGELDKPGRNGMTPVTDAGLKAFFSAIREKGKGFFVIHSGSDTLHKHPEYIKMVGAEFVNHGMQQEAGVEIIGNALPQTEKILGKKFRHFEEWYAFRNFNPDMRVLMMQDTSDMLTEGRNAYYKQPSYPCTWIRGEGKGIVAFTSLGHSCEFWRSKEYRSLLTELLSIVTRLQAVDMTPNYNSVVNTKQ